MASFLQVMALSCGGASDRRIWIRSCSLGGSPAAFSAARAVGNGCQLASSRAATKAAEHWVLHIIAIVRVKRVYADSGWIKDATVHARLPSGGGWLLRRRRTAS